MSKSTNQNQNHKTMNKLLNTKQNQIAVARVRVRIRVRARIWEVIDFSPYFNHSLPPLATRCWVFKGRLDE